MTPPQSFFSERGTSTTGGNPFTMKSSGPPGPSHNHHKQPTEAGIHCRLPSRRPYPDPSDRSSCARFRMRKKRFRGRSATSSPVQQQEFGVLRQMVLELNQHVQQLGDFVLQQAELSLKHAQACSNSSIAVHSAVLEQIAQTVNHIVSKPSPDLPPSPSVHPLSNPPVNRSSSSLPPDLDFPPPIPDKVMTTLAPPAAALYSTDSRPQASIASPVLSGSTNVPPPASTELAKSSEAWDADLPPALKELLTSRTQVATSSRQDPQTTSKSLPGLRGFFNKSK